jgi:hypothetical protein
MAVLTGLFKNREDLRVDLAAGQQGITTSVGLRGRSHERQNNYQSGNGEQGDSQPFQFLPTLAPPVIAWAATHLYNHAPAHFKR